VKPELTAKKAKEIEAAVLKLLSSQKQFLTRETINSPRAVGDAIETILEDNFEKILGSMSSNYSKNFARRAMADLAFEDNSGYYYVIDVKTHNLDTKFNMPNLTSVDRLARFYESDSNVFMLLMVKYKANPKLSKLDFSGIEFVPIEHLSWECLTVGALGWGQIQIANSNNIKLNRGYSRKKWMIELCDYLLEFYPREISKIKKRMTRFEKLKKAWQRKDDIWS